jgi:hypothetical protein
MTFDNALQPIITVYAVLFILVSLAGAVLIIIVLRSLMRRLK